MAIMPSTAVLVVAVLCLIISPAMAEIKSVKIKDDARPMILFEKFGFTRTGIVSVNVSGVSFTSTYGGHQDSAARFGFFLLSQESLGQVIIEIQQIPNFCVLDSKYINLLFTIREISTNKSILVTSPHVYNLFFANCEPDSRVTMEVHTELYNLNDGVKDYLSSDLTQILTIFFLFSLAYLVFLGFWIYTCIINKRCVHQIHLLMTVLLLAKTLNLIFAAANFHSVKITGTPHGWNNLIYIFQFISVVLLFTVIILIGTGYSFLKLTKTMIFVIPFQVLVIVASIMIDKTGPYSENWVTWNLVFLLADIICCLTIILTTIWLKIRSSREASKKDGKAAKTNQFRYFFILVIVYFLFTRIGVFILRAIAAYEYEWVGSAAEETASLAFYMVMFYVCRPIERKESSVIDEKEVPEAEIALKDEEGR